MKIGFVGLGLMGTPMVLRLLQAGYSVRVWNRTPEKMATVVAAGAQQATSVAELTQQCDVLMVCVTNTSAVRDIVFGPQGVTATGRQGQVLVDFSSIAPQATREMATELSSCCGINWVDAPVSGGVVGAEQGTLAMMAGGDGAVIDQLRPVLAVLSRQLTHMGATGTGQVAKICNQMLVSCNVLVMAEVFALAEQAGVQTSLLPQALQGGFADTTPLQLTGPKMAVRDFDNIKWRVNTLLKDMNMASDLAQSLGSAVPMAGLGVELLRQHAGRGFGEQDPATLIHLYMEILSGEDKR
ncbi:NAD(P)-dependent oxidoreductase [Oceanobacter sp. 5_MG-2023]|uniref:NAD(P)-dependent oxidoreductase n=1 Tax=Oceanobacter sp. 5_MG-2023 TaxID=3062645 RepID=UPI0026E1407C|nr:NAD(P)-dependent oxidoreductase [Oceanobacter sp. 5_MG-2023]MDO6682709.1 NAD(P)-dependent oxidoreductase [Oceanobacter sp. 5_MG-2023]